MPLLHAVGGKAISGLTPALKSQDVLAPFGPAFRPVTRPPANHAQIDLLYYSTYLGGTDDDCLGGPKITQCSIALGAQVGTNGVYISGRTLSTDFPRLNAIDNNYDAAGDIFVTKLKLDGSGILYSTYLGGSGAEACYQCAVAAIDRKIYVTGDTASTNFIPAGAPPALDSTNTNGVDAFVTLIESKFSGPSSHLYSTYLGSNASNDYGRDIWVTNDGMVYLTGATAGGFPITPDAFDETAVLYEAYLTKLDLSLGTSAVLLYSTYLGGDSNQDYGGGVTGMPTQSQDVYVGGSTASTDFPHTDGAFQTAPPTGEPFGKHNAFVTKLPAPPSWSTSYYVGKLDELAAMGATLGDIHKSRLGTQDEVVILALGVPDKQNNQFGMTIYNNTQDRFESVDSIRQGVIDFAFQYYIHTGADTASTLRIVVGASNQIKNLGQPLPGQFNFNDPVSAATHGQAWADMVDGINSDLQNSGCCGGQVIVLGGSDIERFWAGTYISPPYSIIRWVEACRDASNCIPATAESGCLYNFGNNDSPPHTYLGKCTGPDSNDIFDTWTQCDLWYVSWGLKRTSNSYTFAQPLPEIYIHDNTTPPLSQDANAELWQQTSAFGSTPMYFVGTLTQYAACSQLGYSCGSNEDNTPGQGWIQLWGSLYSNRNPPGYTGTNTRQAKLRWSTDIRYQCGSLFHSCP